IGKKLSKQTEEFYDNNQVPLSRETSYVYDLATTLNTETKVKSSAGDEIIEKNIYAFQFPTPTGHTGTDSQVDALIRMKDTHNLSTPIEKQTWRTKNGESKLIGSHLTKFRIEHDIVVPSEQYTLIATEPIATYTPPIVVNSVFTFDNSRFLKLTSFLRFNEFGSLLEVSDVSGVTTSFIWGYNK
ncbi:MAG: hypothetical protein ACKO96_21925, partial [Flammeovirgaceae bacterium]